MPGDSQKALRGIFCMQGVSSGDVTTHSEKRKGGVVTIARLRKTTLVPARC